MQSDSAANYGIVQTGGTMRISGSAIGPNARVERHDAQRTQTDNLDHAGESPPWDIGVVTVLPEECRAVVAELSSRGVCRARTHGEGAQCYETVIGEAVGSLSIVCIETVLPGQCSAGPAVEVLRRHYDPAVLVLVGIAGGIDPSVGLGDVVIGDAVICYEMRKESGGRPLRRGRSLSPPAAVQRAVNKFLVGDGHQDDGMPGFRVHRGPIGSGEAVIAERSSEILTYLRGFNDKTLAVDTETAGFAQAMYESVDASRARGRWLVVRGVSDHADEAKDDRYHEAAARNAARTLLLLLPYLRFRDAL